jgi:hypothetical protein
VNADLLRRAAEKLRLAAHEVPTYFPADWHPVFTDSESLTGVRSCPEHNPSGDDLTGPYKALWACDRCEHIETCGEGLAAYIALMHPPVALALADLLDEMVQYTESPLCNPEWPPLLAAVAVAEAILRERAS